MRRPLLLALPALLLLAAPVEAGRRDYVDPKYGFQIKLPRRGDWSQTPTQPGETTEVAKFKDDRRRDFSTLSIFRFPVKGAVTPGEEDAEEPAGYRMPPQFRRPDNAKDWLERSLQRTYRFFGRDPDELPEPETIEFEDDIEGELYAIELEHPRRRGYYYSSLVGIVSDGREEYMIDFTGQQKLRKYARDWKRSIRSFTFPSAETVEEAAQEFEEDLEDRDRTRSRDEVELLDPEKRERFKKDLRGDWRFLDTPHYLVRYNCDDHLAKFIAKRVEYMRTYAYEKVFPPVEPIQEAMIITICKEMDEYHHYGAPRGSAGYWSSHHDELVFPDLSQSRKPDVKTIGVMHHEAFHQYVYYALLKHNPPIWFNEGYAEYFFCVDHKKPSKRRLNFIKRHPMRHSVVKNLAGTDELIPTKDFVKLTHRQYMQDANRCYAQGWAFAKWLMDETREERYQAIPRIFFDELQKGYLEQKEKGGFGGFGGNRERGPVAERAHAKAFEGIDWDEIHEEFHESL